MAQGEALLRRVRALLSERTDVAERRMMGGVSFMVAGHMCCGVSKHRLMVRVGRAAYSSALLEPNVMPLDLGGRRPVGYVLVDRESLAGDGELQRWIARGGEVVAALPARS